MNKQVTLADVKDSIRNVPDFPKPGIQFKDVSTAYNRPEILSFLTDEVVSHYKSKGITKVVGVESRGFILGAAIAKDMVAGFVPVRKPGKLPADTYSQTYDLEYGTDTLEIHTDALCADDVVLIHDDLLATGGTAGAAIELVRQFGVKDIYVNFFVELDFLKGRERIDSAVPVWSVVHF